MFKQSERSQTILIRVLYFPFLDLFGCQFVSDFDIRISDFLSLI